MANVEEFGGITVLFIDREGPRLASEADAVEIVGMTFETSATVVAIPVERFDDMFFHLSTRMAGEFIQKVVIYHRRLAILGDISEHTASSRALRDFVAESNRGQEVWFLDGAEALRARLTSGSATTSE